MYFGLPSSFIEVRCYSLGVLATLGLSINKNQMCCIRFFSLMSSRLSSFALKIGIG
jgi:hypothetical protein